MLPPVAPLVHDAFRFIRMCKTSGDLFDAYRNLFLAFECLLSDIRPRQRAANGRWESEKRWFMDALTAADQLAAVADLAPPGEPNPKDWVYQNIYSAERSALMHAKLGERYLLPHDATSRVQLTRSLENLWRYVKELVAKHLGVTSGSAHLATAGWAMMADPTLREMVLFVSDDASPPNPNANPEISEESTTVELQPGEPHGDPSEPLLRTILASIDPAELSQLDGIRKSGFKEKATSSALVCSELNGPLRLGDSVARFEVLHGVRSVSVKGAPRHFSS